MAKHSSRTEFDNLYKIGIFNPRLNTSYVCDMNDISLDIIKQIEDEVICYE